MNFPAYLFKFWIENCYNTYNSYTPAGKVVKMNSKIFKAEDSLERCQGCQLTPLEFWRLTQLNHNFSRSVSQNCD